MKSEVICGILIEIRNGKDFGEQMEQNKLDKKDNGVRTFFGILRKYFFQLILLNLFFVVTCIPIITIGPACKALAQVTMDLVRDNTMTPGMDYFKAFKTNFLTVALSGCAITTLLAVMIYAVVINLRTPNLSITMLIIAMVAIVMILYIAAIIMYALNLFATIDLPAGQIWKNAALLVFLSPKQMILLMLLVVAPGILFCMIYEIGLVFFIIGFFSFASLISSINAWTIIKKYVATKEDQELSAEEK